MDDFALEPWISTALISHFDNQDNNKSLGHNQEVTSHGYCHVWNVKIFDKPIGGMMGMCNIDDSQLYIKALFTENAVQTFEENEALTSCLGFGDINNSIMELRKYHIMMDITPEIEECKLAICVDEFLISSPSMSFPSRDSLIEAISFSTIARHIRHIWRGQYNSQEQDSCSTKVFSEDTSQEQDALSQLLELIENTSQNMTPYSETDQWSDEQCPHCGYFEVEKADNQRTLRSSEVLLKVIQNVEKRLIWSIENPECVKRQIPDTVVKGKGCRVHPIPARELLDLTVELIDPAECDTPDDVMQILDNMEEWKVDYVPPCPTLASESSSIDIPSFNTLPSVEHREKDAEEKEQSSHSSVFTQRCKRKVAFSPSSESHCKMAKSSEGHESKIIREQDQGASKCLNSNKLLDKVQLQSVPQREKETECEEENQSENSEIAEGLTQLCHCLTPCEEDEDEVAGVQQKRSSACNASNSLLAKSKESRRKSQQTCLRENEESNRIGIGDYENSQEELIVSCDRRQNLEGDSFSDESTTSESLLLSCDIRESLSDEKMNKEQLEDLKDEDTDSDHSTDLEDITQLEMVPSASNQQPMSCPKERSQVKSAQDSKGIQQHVDFQMSPKTKLVQTIPQILIDGQHKSSKETSNTDMFVDAPIQTADTSRKTSGVINVAKIPKVDKPDLKKTELPSTSRTSFDFSAKSSNVRPLDKPSQLLKPAQSSSLIASMCSLKMCGSDWISKSVPSLIHSQSRLKENPAIANSSKRRSTDGTTDGEDVSSRLKNYKLEKHILEWCASVASNNSQGASIHTGQ